MIKLREVLKYFPSSFLGHIDPFFVAFMGNLTVLVVWHGYRSDIILLIFPSHSVSTSLEKHFWDWQGSRSLRTWSSSLWHKWGTDRWIWFHFWKLPVMCNSSHLLRCHYYGISSSEGTEAESAGQGRCNLQRIPTFISLLCNFLVLAQNCMYLFFNCNSVLRVQWCWRLW